MKKLPMISLLIVPYAVIIVCYQLNLDMTIGLCIYGALLLFNIVYAFLLPGLGFDGKQLMFWNLLLKLCNIPLVTLIRLFALVMVLAGGKSMEDDRLTLVLITLLVLFVVRLSSAVFGISGYRWCRKNGTLSQTGVIVSSVIQLVPFIDVIGSVLCYIMFRKDGQTEK